MGRFIKYHLELTDKTESEFETQLANSWDQIKEETKIYGLHGFGLTNQGAIVAVGEIEADTAAEVNGRFSSLKSWLRNKYATQVKESMIAKGSFR